MGDVEGWWSIGREVIECLSCSVYRDIGDGMPQGQFWMPHEAGHELYMQSLSGLWSDY